MNTQTKVKPLENTEIENAPILRRFGAFLVDFVSFFLLYFLLFLAVRPILDATMDINGSINAYNQEVVTSHLYEVDDEEIIPSSSMYVQRTPQISVAATKYAEATYRFYTQFMATNHATDEVSYDHEWYVVNVLKIDESTSFYVRGLSGNVNLNSSVASDTSSPSSSSTSSEPAIEHDVFLPPNVSLKAGITVAQVKDYNMKIYLDARWVFSDLPNAVKSNNEILLETIVIFLFASTIVYLTIPLVLKNGQTLGKLLLKIGLTNRLGYSVSMLKIVLRYLTFFTLYLLTLAAFIPAAFVFAFLALTFAIFTKKTTAIHDLITFTRVVDLKKSTIYQNQDEYLQAHHELSEEVK